MTKSQLPTPALLLMTERFYWKAKLIRGGPYIPVMTFFGGPLVDGEVLDRSPRWQAIVRSETTGRVILMGDQCPIEVDGVFLRNIEPIDEATYTYMVKHAEYATAYAPHMPDASPNVAIDFNKMKPAI